MGIVLEVLLPPFVACLVLTGIHTYLGLHVVSRGVIFVDLALAQIAALGATFAFLLGYDPHGSAGYVYSLVFTVIGAAIFSISRLKDQRIPQEAIIGITFAVASATAILIADRAPQGAEFVEAMLTGALLWVPWPTIWKTAAVYAVLGVFHWIYRRRFLTISMEPAKAAEQGWNVRWWDFLFYASFGLVITSSVAMAGILLVFSFLVIPSMIAMLFATSIAARLSIGWTAGTLVSMIGLALSYTQDFPSGPAVVCTFGGAIVIAGVSRYLMRAEQPMWAVARVGAAGLMVVGGFWLAWTTAAVFPGGEEIVAEERAGALDPAEQANRALAELSASTGPPPAEAVASLVAVHEDLHLLMATGAVDVTESAVQAIARAGEGQVVTELLEEIAYHAIDPWARLRGAEALVTRRRILGIEALIEMLEHEHPVLVQLQVVEILRRVTGENFAFDPQSDEEAKDRAAFRWRRWWNEHRGDTSSQSGGV